MKSSAKKVELAPYDDLFSTEESRQDAKLEKIQEIPLSELHPFKGHPFKVKDDEAMMETADSVRQYGVLVPAIARPDPEGGYELVAGHRRHRASELAEKETMPVIVRDLDDDAATIIMVDSNLQRESLLPSERAFAYKMKLEAMKRKAGRPTKAQLEAGYKPMRADEQLAQQTGESRATIQRLTRLTKLEPELQDMVEEKKLPVNTAADISYLKPQEQKTLADAIKREDKVPSGTQAAELKKESQAGKLTAVVTQNIDGLHQKAGSKCVYELHGSVYRNYCEKCGKFYPPEYIRDSAGVPRCTCGGRIKPDVVLYEESLDQTVIEGAVRAIADAEVLIVGGTSLTVYPAAGLIRYYRGNKLVLINRDETPYDTYANLIFRDPIGKVLGAI